MPTQSGKTLFSQHYLETRLPAGSARLKARARYAVDRQTRHRILTDLGAPGRGLNRKLTAWWELDFPGFLGEVSHALRRDIPLKQRDDWEGWLAVRRAEHEQAPPRSCAWRRSLTPASTPCSTCRRRRS